MFQNYNAIGQLCAVTPTSGCAAANPYANGYGYDAAGHVTGFSYGNGVAATYAFEPTRSQLATLTYTKAGAAPTQATGSVTISGTLQSQQQQTQSATPGQATIPINFNSSNVSNTFTPIGCPGGCQTITTYNSGNISVTVSGPNGTNASASTSFGPPPPVGNSSSQQIASDLAGQLNGSLVSASAGNGSILITAAVPGQSTNYPFSTSFTYNNTETCPTSPCFSGPSFYASPASGALSGGRDAQFQTNYDQGTTTITVNGHGTPYSWSGPGTTAASIAQGLCNNINGDTGAFVYASTNGTPQQCPLGSTTVSLVSRQSGAGTDFPLRASSSSSQSSFSTSCSGFASCDVATLTGGAGVPHLLSLAYGYKNGQANCGTGATAGNSGLIQCIQDLTGTQEAGRSVAYRYDPLNRLASAVTLGSSGYPQWGLSETYDRFGNRWTQQLTAGSGPSPSLVFGASGMNSSTTNQPNGYTFDASGNLTIEPLSPPSNYTYDGENRMTAFSGIGGAATYTYDGNGMRLIKSVSGGTTTVSIFSDSTVIAEYDNGAAPTAPTREYVYAGNRMLAMISGGSTTYYHGDHLSTRLTTDANANKLSEEGHYPFGEQWYQTSGTNKWFFTTYARDSESGLDYALARYYNSRTGTFCSADPVAGSPDDPQSWNRYPYGRNDPIDITDPSGKFLEFFALLLAEFLPQAAEVSAPIWVPGVTITVTATAPLIETIGFYTAEALPLAGAAVAPAGQAPLSEKDLQRFQKAQQNAKRNVDNKDCDKFLTSKGIDPSGLKNAIQNMQPWNGAKSTISQFDAGVFDPQDPFNVQQGARAIESFKSSSVASMFQSQSTGTTLNAVAQNGGNNVYFRPGGLLSAGGITAASVFHEALHNLTGKGDTRLAQQLGLPRGSESQDINPELAKHHCL